MKKSICLAVFSLSTLAAGLGAHAQDTRSYLMGSSIPAAAGQRTIVLSADTKWVNVNQGEEIKFVAGGTEFGWRFDGPGSRSFDLRQVAPAGALTNPVTAYIAGSAGHPAR